MLNYFINRGGRSISASRRGPNSKKPRLCFHGGYSIKKRESMLPEVLQMEHGVRARPGAAFWARQRFESCLTPWK